jgi:hypothetical protein
MLYQLSYLPDHPAHPGGLTDIAVTGYAPRTLARGEGLRKYQIRESQALVANPVAVLILGAIHPSSPWRCGVPGLETRATRAGMRGQQPRL